MKVTMRDLLNAKASINKIFNNTKIPVDMIWNLAEKVEILNSQLKIFDVSIKNLEDKHINEIEIFKNSSTLSKEEKDITVKNIETKFLDEKNILLDKEVDVDFGDFSITKEMNTDYSFGLTVYDVLNLKMIGMVKK